MPCCCPPLAATLSQVRRAQAQAQRANREKQNALTDLGHAEPLSTTLAALLALGLPRPGQMDMALNLRGIKAGALSRLGRLGPAVAEYEIVLAEVKRLGRMEQARTKTVLNQYGLALMRGGQSLTAADAIGQSVAMSLTQGDAELVDIGTQTNLARALVEIGRGAEALPHFEQALGNAQRTGDRRNIAGAALNAARGVCDLRDVTRCADLLKLGAGHLTAVLPAGNPGPVEITVGRARLALAQVQLQQGDAASSLATAQRAVQLARTTFEDFPTSTPLGQAQLATGEADSPLQFSCSAAPVTAIRPA